MSEAIEVVLRRVGRAVEDSIRAEWGRPAGQRDRLARMAAYVSTIDYVWDKAMAVWLVKR